MGTLDLDPDQQRVVDAVTGPVLVYAGPGTGKTRVVTHRVAAQVRERVVEASAVLAVTFTDKAASELLGRLRALDVPAGGRGGVRAATFHSAALAQVRWFWPRVTGANAPEVLSSKVPMLANIRERPAPLRGVTPPDLAAEIEWVKSQGATLNGERDAGGPGADGRLAALDISGQAPRWQLDAEAYAAVLEHHDGPWDRALPRGSTAEAFAELFDAYEEAKTAAGHVDFDDMLATARALVAAESEVAAAVRGRYTHLTVDEFQDVNRLQWDLLTAWLGDREQICIVGDADQSIYGFSGASPVYLDEFRERFPSATLVRLGTNYRSTQPILDLAARLLSMGPGDRRDPLGATRAGRDLPVLVTHRDEDGERQWVIQRCRELNGSGIQWQEMAVLYRFNAQSEAWEEAFARAGIPYVVRGDEGFFGRRHVQQAITVLEQAARAGLDRPDPDDPLVALDGAEPATPELDRVVRRVLRQRMKWTDKEPEGDRARERWADLAVLVDLASEVSAADPDAGLDELIEDLSERRALGTAPDGGGVNLITLHRAKGLEFDAVFVVSAEDGRVPSRYAVEHDERLRIGEGDPRSSIAEERRLFYVGMTRARQHLHVTWVERGQKRPSRFLKRLAGSREDGSGRRRAELKRPARERDEPPPLDDAAAELFESLREWRLSRSMSDGVPPYIVFHDRTLQEIARTKPRSRAQLFAVAGVGKAKLDRYGEDVLALVEDAPT